LRATFGISVSTTAAATFVAGFFCADFYSLFHPIGNFLQRQRKLNLQVFSAVWTAVAATSKATSKQMFEDAAKAVSKDVIQITAMSEVFPIKAAIAKLVFQTGMTILIVYLTLIFIT
jgi:flagellar motor component MotA